MTDYYMGFATEAEVMTFSQGEAWLRGCQNQPEDVTQYWQGWISHPVRVEFALVIPDANSNPIQDTTGYTLQTEAEMEADDWFIGV